MTTPCVRYLVASALWLGSESESLLNAVSMEQPNPLEFQPMPALPHRIFPVRNNITFEGPRATNKFWTHWTENADQPNGVKQEDLAVWSSPYALRWGGQGERYAEQMHVMSRGPDYVYGFTPNPLPWKPGGADPISDDRIGALRCDFRCHISLGTVEGNWGNVHSVFHEDLFGVRMMAHHESDVTKTVEYPVFSGMAYVSARYSGGLTPKVSGCASAMTSILRVGTGQWQVMMEENSESDSYVRNGEWRVYALNADMTEVDADLDFNSDGEMSRPFDGWIRVARVVQPSDRAVLDQYRFGLVTGCTLGVESTGPTSSVLTYNWELVDGSQSLLHYGWAHHRLLMPDNQVDMSQIQAPTKGYMSGFVGNPWQMTIDRTEAESLSFMPERSVPELNKAQLLAQASSDFQRFKRNHNLLFDLEHYFTGKFFQMCSQLCLILKTLKGSGDPETLECADVLETGFAFLHTRSQDGVPVNPEDRAAGGFGPASLVYDGDWGGIVTRWGFYDECWIRDFGNACYNDHHYHFGYFVTAASVLVHLKPSAKENVPLTHYVDTLIRDTTNPTSDDTWFPLFRGYDWFDFHSWSHGVNSFAEGKDQESVSEDINLQYGMILWGRETDRPWLSQLGSTLLSCNFMAIKQYFLMRTGNPNHHPDFAINHVTGVFYQNSIEYSTWFTKRVEWIHAIQMLPATPALLKIRDAEFCQQEWDDVLAHLSDDRVRNPYDDGPSSIVTMGSLSMFDAVQAWEVALTLTQLDNGVSRAWMLYWIAAQPSFPDEGIAPPGTTPPISGPIGKTSLLRPIDTAEPDPIEFVRFEPPPHRIFPVGSTNITGPKATNKFWTQWTEAAERGGRPEEKAVWPMPFALKFRERDGRPTAEMMISHPRRTYQRGNVWGNNVPDDRIALVSAPFDCGLALGAQEDIGIDHNVFHEDLFGIKMLVTGSTTKPDASIYYPVFSGMAFVSARYLGGLKPRITDANGGFNFKTFERVNDGIWQVITQDDDEWRVYALRPDASKIEGGRPQFDDAGVMQEPFDGWIRVAKIEQESDRLVFDQNALCVVDGGELEVSDNLSSSQYVGYKWHCHQDEPTHELLHYGWAHHEMLLPQEQKAPGLSNIEAASKGAMTGFLGREWHMYLDSSKAMSLSYLPDGHVPEINQAEIVEQVSKDFEHYQSNVNSVFHWEFYRTGKNFQKLGTICLLLSELRGRRNAQTQACSALLETVFKCLHTRNVGTRENAENQDLGEVCGSGPMALIYDSEWGGIVHRYGYYDWCWAADYGNACYNDHHYHYGYFVVAASILVHLKPDALADSNLQAFVDTMIRDTTNPSTAGLDTYFPPFRGFDWFDFHSWSHGVNALPQGKDQESVSEDINLQYGMILWGRATRRPFIEKLGATLLSCNFIAIEQYFFMRTGNTNHHVDFVKNHVTGIFYQSSINYTTWFNPAVECIHGIQMMPMTPALLAIRDPDFARQEWEDVLSKLPDSQKANVSWGWTSVITAGSLALFDAGEAYQRMRRQERLDGGLSRGWTMYWMASRPSFPVDGLPGPTPTEAPETTTTEAPAGDNDEPQAGMWIFIVALVIGVAVVGVLMMVLSGASERPNLELGAPVVEREGARSVNV